MIADRRSLLIRVLGLMRIAAGKAEAGFDSSYSCETKGIH